MDNDVCKNSDHIPARTRSWPRCSPRPPSGLAAFPQAATAAESDVTPDPNPAYAGAPFKGWGSSLVVDGERDRLVPGRAAR